MNTLTIHGLTKTYKNGVKALDNVSLEIGNGMFGLLGPNGAGKSSLMKTIVGLQKPDSGDIRFNNEDILKHPDFIKKQVGFVPQDFGVYPKVSTYDLLNHLAILKGVYDAKERKAQITDLLERVNLIAQKDKEVHTFSGGMKQRFGIAQALLGHPKIIIVDEPTAGLDPEERNRINHLLSDIGEEIIVMLSTHLVEDVRNLCPDMAIICKGVLRAFGKPADMVARLKGKLWKKKIEKSERGFYRSKHCIITYYLVEKSLYITAFSEQRPDGFMPTAPTLEHVYFHTLYHQDTRP